jgi:hypothetical protein
MLPAKGAGEHAYERAVSRETFDSRCRFSRETFDSLCPVFT